MREINVVHCAVYDVEKETEKGMMDSIKKDYDNQKEGEKQEEEKQAAAAPVITLDELMWRRRRVVRRRKENAEEKKEENAEEEEKYHEEFKQALQKQVGVCDYHKR